MAKVLLGISIALLLCAAGLGWVTKGKVEQKVALLTETKQNLAKTEDNLKSTSNKLKDTSEKLTASEKTVEEDATKITDLTAKATAADEAAKKATEAVTEKETLIASLNETVEKLKNPPPGAPTEIPGMKDLEEKLAKANTELAEAKVMQTNFQSRQKSAEENLVVAQTRIKQLEAPILRAGLSGNVVAVNNGWNFVVIDLGDKQGVSVNSPLLVMRGSQRVATLKITSVEPRTSIADVVPGSMARGTIVQPGDRVVFAGTRGNPASVPPPAAGAGADAPAAVTVPVQ